MTTESEEKKPKEYGYIKFSGKDLPPQDVKYDRLAMSNSRELLLVSVVAEANIVKAIRSILAGGAKCDISARVGKVRSPFGEREFKKEPGNLNKSERSYDCHTQKLEHGLVHAMFISRTEGFMPITTDEAIWQELKDVRFTTPIIRDWLPYIKAELVAKELLTFALCFNVTCGLLSATTVELDGIVSEGLRERKILIP